ATAARAELFPDGVAASAKSMATLNRSAAEVMEQYPVHACTDITGFGLLGHLYEMASGSKMQMEIVSGSIPLLLEAAAAAAMGLVPVGAYTNREYLKTITIDRSVPENIIDLCFDPQTSGGLLISVPPSHAEKMLVDLHQAGLKQAAVIGRVTKAGRGEIYVS
ncbi:MAG TPA: AIR synthase-related protein, partial [Negativicutes bacterium]